MEIEDILNYLEKQTPGNRSKIIRPTGYFAKASKRSRDRKKVELLEIQNRVDLWRNEKTMLEVRLNSLQTEVEGMINLDTLSRLDREGLELENIYLKQEIQRYRNTSISLKRFIHDFHEEEVTRFSKEMLGLRVHIKYNNLMQDLINGSYQSLHDPNWKTLSNYSSTDNPFNVKIRTRKFLDGSRSTRLDYEDLPISYDSVKERLQDFLEEGKFKERLMKAYAKQEPKRAHNFIKVDMESLMSKEKIKQRFIMQPGTDVNVIIKRVSNTETNRRRDYLNLVSVSSQTIEKSALYSNDSNSKETVEAIFLLSKSLSDVDIEEMLPEYTGKLQQDELNTKSFKPTMHGIVLTKSSTNSNFSNVTLFLQNNIVTEVMAPANYLEDLVKSKGLHLTYSLLGY